MPYRVELTQTDVGTMEASHRTMNKAFHLARRKMGEQFDREAFAQGFANCFLAMSISRKAAAVGHSDAARQYHVRIERHRD